jgi:hypothetical protein
VGQTLTTLKNRTGEDSNPLGWVHTCNVTAYRNTVSCQCGRDSWQRNVSKVGYAVTLRACSVCCQYLAVASKGWYGYGRSRCGRATWRCTFTSDHRARRGSQYRLRYPGPPNTVLHDTWILSDLLKILSLQGYNTVCTGKRLSFRISLHATVWVNLLGDANDYISNSSETSENIYHSSPCHVPRHHTQFELVLLRQNQIMLIPGFVQDIDFFLSVCIN